MENSKKLYCRAFQTIFKLALPVLPYRTPRILNKVEEVPEVLKKKRIPSVMILTDPGISSLGLIKPLERGLNKMGIHYYIYDRVCPNPTTQNVNDALDAYYMHGCHALIGFGGGSSIDCAKAVGVLIARPGKTLGNMEGILKVQRGIPLLIAIPTTAGTGSETTLAAVITDSDTRHKYPINDFALIPDIAVLDPKNTISLPRSITATTGMDALTHAVEAYIGNNTSPCTRGDALKAVNLIFKYIRRAYDDGYDMEARKYMLHASFYAGCAFSKSYVGYVHAVAHSLGGEYNTPHGLANAVLLPFVLEAYGSSIYGKLKDLAIAAGVAREEDDEESAAKAFIRAIKDMKKYMNIGDTIAGIQKKDIRKLARYADKEANPLYPVPVLMDAAELEKFYYILMEKQGGKKK